MYRLAQRNIFLLSSYEGVSDLYYLFALSAVHCKHRLLVYWIFMYGIKISLSCIFLSLLTCICLMAGVPTEMTFNTTSTVKLCQTIIVMMSQCATIMRFWSRHSRCASHRTMHMSYRSKAYTWNDVILIKRSVIWVSSCLIFDCQLFSHFAKCV